MRLKLIKIRKNSNRCNSVDSDFRSTDERSLETRNLALWNALSFISIRFMVPEISSFKEKSNFWSFTISLLVAYSDLSLAPRFTDLSQTSDEWQTRFLKKKNVVHISRKKCRSRSIHDSLHYYTHYEIFDCLYLGNRLRYRDETKKDFNGTVSSIFWVCTADEIF